MRCTKRNIIIVLFLLFAIAFTSCSGAFDPVTDADDAGISNPIGDGSDTVAFIDHNGGVPSFEFSSDIKPYEKYSELDPLGRCGIAEACLAKELMPTEEREPLSSVKPSGWNQAQYKGLVDGDYLYNRCHLIGFQLAGEQANKKNLITGTRFMNVEGMLPFENMVADYIKETGNRVMYRATPVYAEDYDLVPSGVILEALSIEDNGEGISFCVYIFNKQPGIVINYRDGSSHLSGTKPTEPDQTPNETPAVIVINKNSKKFHLPSCSGVASMSTTNREDRNYYDGIIDELIKEGFIPCGTCKPAGEDAA